MQILRNQQLKSYNTLGISATAKYFSIIESREDVREIIGSDTYRSEEKLVLGGGSNILFSQDFDGLVLFNSIKGIQEVSQTDSEIILEAGGGEEWDSFVGYCAERNYGGLENLSLIPGTIGAAPVQNIGAYGAELSDVFESLELVDIETGEEARFTAEECKFGYRMSIFKSELKNRVLITKVRFRLRKKPLINLSYAALKNEFDENSIDGLSIKDIRETVIRIRRSKLPDPGRLPNAGSFFKNPEIGGADFERLRSKYTEIPGFPLSTGNYKIPAAWLIEKCGLKGIRLKDAGTYEKHALVIVNHGKATGKDIEELSFHIINKVKEKFGITLIPEVNII
jgi:UDP-N-acetylmuramate dehydrogenase